MTAPRAHIPGFCGCFYCWLGIPAPNDAVPSVPVNVAEDDPAHREQLADFDERLKQAKK